MNRDLTILRDWATDRAQKDDDTAARPLWGQIAAEVSAYLDGDELYVAPDQQPLDFGGVS